VQSAASPDQRVDRILANLGYGTRAEARAMVAAGRVAAGGRRVTSPAQKAPAVTVTLDGEPLDAPGGLFVALHKPTGYVCSHSDRDGPPVWQLLPSRWLQRNPRPTTVGRLDMDSSGLLLVTDLHPLVHELTAPRRHVPKRYVVTLADAPADPDRLVAAFVSGTVQLRGDDVPCRPAELRPLPAVDGEGVTFEVVLTEGRHRQVRRMFAALGAHVVALHRTAVGPYELGDLAPGAWRVEDPSLVRD
jgi:16S rRNA pseudouridine516 synthase